MEISKHEALILYGVLCQYSLLTQENLSDELENFVCKLSEFLTGEEYTRSEDFNEKAEGEDSDNEEEEIVDEDDVEVEELEADSFVASASLSKLHPLTVEVNGEKKSFEFEDIGQESHVNVLIGDDVFDRVTHIKILDKEIHFFSEETKWHTFSCPKVTKSWLKTLSKDVLYEVGFVDEEE